MNYNERLQHVSVLGAAGKMGSGILLLSALEMTDLRLKTKAADGFFVLNAIDVSNQALNNLSDYIRAQALKTAEKKLDWLKELWAENKNLLSDADFMQAYAFEVLKTIRNTTRLETAYDSTLIFEAVSENRSLKVKIFKQIDQNNPHKAWFFTNTSSIPIGEIEKEAELLGRVVGFHFYNPPAIQKLVELILTPNTSTEAKEFALQLAANMKKIVIESNDYAGFIGNGHFMRDALYAIEKAQALRSQMPLYQAIYVVNKISQEYLIRPMGIFQLIDYVGIDVVQFIMNVMNPYLANENLHSELLDKMMELQLKGGQFSDGSQKNGFFTYIKGKPSSVYCTKTGQYIAFEQFAETCNQWLGEFPVSLASWKEINFSKNKHELLTAYFADLVSMSNQGAELAKEYHKKSCEIAKFLVTSGVAKSDNDVNSVMLTGFYHACPPINTFLE